MANIYDIPNSVLDELIAKFCENERPIQVAVPADHVLRMRLLESEPWQNIGIYSYIDKRKATNLIERFYLFLESSGMEKVNEVNEKEIDINANQPHEVCELMCVKCFRRWIGIYPQKALLKDMICECGAVGTVIKTGQTIQEVDDDGC